MSRVKKLPLGKRKLSKPMDKEDIAIYKTANIIRRDICDELKDSYLAYSVSVITSRAIPHLKDGLKPSQRRILYVLKDATYNMKSARIVGDVLGKYHPHGDSAVYGTMVRLCQPFKMYVPYGIGHGNFGSLDASDSPAAPRYCLTGDAVIKTKTHGDISYNELALMYGLSQPYSEVDIDIEVKSMNGEINKSTKLFHSGFHPTMELVLRNGLKIRGTKNHPVLTVVRGKSLQWKTLETLTLDDVVVIDSSHNQFIDNKEDDLLEARFLGCMVSEGYIASEERNESHNDYRIGMNNTDMNMIQPVIDYVKYRFDKDLHVGERILKSGSLSYDICLTSKEFHKEMVEKFHFGRNSLDRGLPKNTRYKSQEYICELLKYLFEGDGSVGYSYAKDTSGYLVYSTISKRLANDIRGLLLDLGIEVLISEDRKTRQGKNSKEIKLYIGGRHNMARFYELIGFVSERKQTELYKIVKNIRAKKVTYNSPYATPYDSRTLTLQSVANQSGLEMYGDDVYDILEQVNFLRKFYRYMRAIRIKSIKDTGCTEAVYSIRVDSECHSYVSNGIISHNTEAKVNPETLDIFFKHNQLGVVYEKNYDNTLDIAEHLVPLIPMSLVNGTVGTAVGFATDFPTHNPKEVIDTYIAYMNGKLTNKNIRKYLKGPDPVMPCYIIDDVSIDRGYQTGRGSYYAMLPYIVEDEGRGRKRIVFTSVLPDKAKDSMINELVLKCRDQKNPLSQMIADIRDESSKEGVRICVITKRDADLNATIEALINARFCYAKFNISNVLIVNGVPKRLGIIDMLKEFHKMNTETSVRHLTTLKENKERRLHILDGIELVIENYDTVIDIIRKSKGKEEARIALQKKYKGLSDMQVNAILDTKLYTLINKGDSIKAERKVIKEEVKEINHNLKDIDGYILNLLEDLKKTLKPYAKRRCEIISKIPKTPV